MIPTGSRLGPYEIVGSLGAGGMGEVYRARDTQLNRSVAIKVLPELFAADSERLARFTREAQTLAALNHPNIAHIHGLEGDGSPERPRALVMELVEGEDLSALIDRRAIPIAEALPIASVGARCRSRTCWRSPGRSPTPSKPHMRAGSFIAI